MFRFIHASDLHIDSPLRGLDRYEGAPVERLRTATRSTLERLVDKPSNKWGRESFINVNPYGNPFSNQSATNPFATDAPRLSDQQGNYRGKLSANPYDPDSTSNPYGHYGSPFSPDSIKNPYGTGNPYSPSSPTNPYGRGLRIEGR